MTAQFFKRIDIKFTVFYVCSVLVLTGIIVAISLSIRHNQALSADVTSLQNIKSNLAKMKNAPELINAAIEDIKKAIPEKDIKTPEVQVFAAVDELKAKFQGSDVSFTAMEQKSNEIIMPVIIKGSFDDYTDFTNVVGNLQTWKSPFFVIDSISLTEGKRNESVDFELKAKLRTIKN
ncbi:MAG: hypothetical protein EPN22_14400 [Nitrospirae bacterium]|nr:MAG: hypothetical protein EPN22_14400 [Nitrospirota bacterium]